MVEIHFYTRLEYLDRNNAYIKYKLYACDWDETEERFDKIKTSLKRFGGCINPQLHTLQMSFLREAWDLHFEYGARIFVHDSTGVYEIKEGCERTDRELRRAHNIFKIWRAGGFNPLPEKGEINGTDD